MADTTHCPHCQEPIPRVRQTQRCPHCGKVVLVKPLAGDLRSAGRTHKFWQQMSLFQGEVLVARIVLIVLALAAALVFLIGC